MHADVAVERAELTDCDGDLAFVDIWLRDGAGRLNNGVQRDVTVAVEGPGVLMGLGSGNPCTDEDYFADTCKSFFGHAFAAIRPTGKGTITVTVRVEGCEAVKKEIVVK